MLCVTSTLNPELGEHTMSNRSFARKGRLILASVLASVFTVQAGSSPLTFASPLTTSQTAQSTAQEFMLREDTPVRLRLNRTISSGTEKMGDKVDFEVMEDVKVNDVIVIKQGASAIGTVTKAKKKASFGRSGNLDVNIDYVTLASGDRANLRAVQGGAGGGRKGVVTAGIVASAVLLWPAAPAFFFIKGKNITIPKGTESTAYIAADTRLERGKYASVAR